MDVRTKGNVIINKIEVGDILYEFQYGVGIKTEVITKPERNEDGVWSWKAKNTESGRIINYVQNEIFPHYGLNIYTYPAYKVSVWLK